MTHLHSAFAMLAQCSKRFLTTIAYHEHRRGLHRQFSGVASPSAPSDLLLAFLKSCNVCIVFGLRLLFCQHLVIELNQLATFLLPVEIATSCVKSIMTHLCQHP